MIDIKAIENAIKLTQDGKFEEAEKVYKNLLDENPDEPNLLATVGLFYINTGDYNRAKTFLGKAYEIKKTLGTVSALGFAEFETGDFANSAKYLEESLNYGTNPDIYNKLILSLFEIKNYKDAVFYAHKMYELYPDNVLSAANEVKALTHSGKMLEAQQLCIDFLKKQPNSPSLWFHLGYLKELIYSDDRMALECYKAAEKLGSREADYNIAVSYQKLGDFENAEIYYKKMLENFPDDKETLTSTGMFYLSQKKFKEGYDFFYKRRITGVAKNTNNLWKVGDKIDKDMVIICDQGFGDHIQFIRYLSFLKEHSVKVAAPECLKNLFQKNYNDVEFIDYSEINPDTQAFRITDLAYALDMDFEHIPFPEGYLDIEKGEPILSEKKKVGLCWEAGSAGIRTMINRTINVKCFEQFFNLNNIQTYSFQYIDSFKGCEKFPQMINLAKDFKDFSDTARALKEMDLLITVDTSVAHLAGAMGIKTYLLLPYAPDWRWFNDTKTTPWYKSVEIFKQVDNISWAKPLEEIMEKLNN